ncbi:MAG: winged helix-turn-helix domain-containing protein [Bryobacteraceae bacterium]|jgi:Tol biopolymer transport system component/DNA-binding winged helix-turn-helix (wHTH) protein
MPDSPPPVVRFGPFELDGISNELRKRGVRVKLQDLPLRILFLLSQEPGRLVTRAALQQALWANDTFVDFERGLNTAMSKLREALGDSAAAPLYIETVPKRGYRFIGEVQYPKMDAAPEKEPVAGPAKVVPLTRPSSAAGALGASAALPETVPRPEHIAAPFVLPPRPLRRKRRSWWLAAVALGLVAAATLGWLIGTDRWLRTSRDEPVIEPLTSYPNDEYDASFSPDGSQVVFSWTREDHEAKLYIKQVGSGPARQLTFGPGRDEFAAWSPDGQTIAFQRALRNVLIVSPQGGSERKIGETESYHLAWTPDARELILAATRPRTQNSDLYAVSVSTGARRRLTAPSDSVVAYTYFGISPDGRWLGYIGRTSAQGSQELCIRPVAGGPARQITALGADIFGWSWTPDSREIILSSNRGGFPALSRVRTDGERRTPLAILLPGEQNMYPFMAPFRIDRPGDRPMILGYESWRRTMNLQEQRLDAPDAAPVLVAPSSHDDYAPQYSPDGKRIVFVSNRTGFAEVWLAEEGKEPAALTAFAKAARLANAPRWSPDGRRIAFSVQEGGGEDLYVLTLDGGGLHRLTYLPSVQNLPSWSRDGKWIYFGSNASGQWQLWRIRSDAPSPAALETHLENAEMLTIQGGADAFESTDGAWLYFTRAYGVDLWRSQGSDLWRMPMVNGKPNESAAEVVIRDLVSQGWWGLAQNGIFFADIRLAKLVAHPAVTPKPVYFFDPVTRRMRQVATITRRMYYFRPDFCVAPDGSRILYSQLDVQNIDLTMVRNFR